MFKELIEAIQSGVKTEAIRLGDRTFTTRQVYKVQPVASIPTLRISTLTGLLTYIESNPDQLELVESFLQIESATQVRLLMSVDLDSGSRDEPIGSCCTSINGKAFRFGEYLAIEQMIIDLQSKFVPSEDLAQLLSIIGNLKTEEVNSYNDDGVTQTVQTKRGISLVEHTSMPPKVRLAPRRTFPEIDQPYGEFVVRLKKGSNGIECALFESDCSGWQAQSIASIATYLREGIEAIGTIDFEIPVIA